MRISHTQLDMCVGDPVRWTKSILVPAGGSHGFAMTYDRALRLAIHQFHKCDENTARKYLQDLILRQQSKGKCLNITKVNRIINDLRSYIKWIHTTAAVVIDSEFLLKDASQRFLTLGGKISRLDFTDDGYRIVLFGKPTVSWKQELRMPLIQDVISQMYNRPVNEIVVGFQQTDGRDLQTTNYSIAEIAKARKQFESLARIVEEQALKEFPLGKP